MSETKPLQFTATEEQLRTLIALAVYASRPAGMGIMHYTERSMGECERIAMSYLQPNSQGAISLDYVEGRMVKLCLLPVREQGETKRRWEKDGKEVTISEMAAMEDSDRSTVRFAEIKPPIIPHRYEFNIDVPRSDYQSWAWKYPTLESLLKAADIYVQQS